MRFGCVRSPLSIGVLMALSLPVVGCGAKEDSEGKAAGDATELDGTWTTGCYAQTSGDGTIEGYDKTTMTFSGSSGTGETASYPATDTACASPDFTFAIAFDFTIGDEVSAPAGAKAIDTTPTLVEMTVKNADWIAGFNQVKTCGLDGWVVDEKKDVTTAKCDEDGTANNATTYGIFKLDGAKLTYGNTDDAATDGTTAAKRPTALSTNKADIYTKQ